MSKSNRYKYSRRPLNQHIAAEHLEMARQKKTNLPKTRKSVRAKLSDIIDSFQLTIKEYAVVSSITGLKYILERGSSIFVR